MYLFRDVYFPRFRLREGIGFDPNFCNGLRGPNIRRNQVLFYIIRAQTSLRKAYIFFTTPTAHVARISFSGDARKRRERWGRFLFFPASVLEQTYKNNLVICCYYIYPLLLTYNLCRGSSSCCSHVFRTAYLTRKNATFFMKLENSYKNGFFSLGRRVGGGSLRTQGNMLAYRACTKKWVALETVINDVIKYIIGWKQTAWNIA